MMVFMPRSAERKAAEVAAGAGAEDEHFALEIGRAAVAGRGRCGNRGSRRRCGRAAAAAGARGGCWRARFHLDQHGTLADAGAELNQHFLDRAFDRAGHIHRRLVRTRG